MTDTSSFAATHPLPQQSPVTAPTLAFPLVNGSLSDTNGQDEEDYTIKCICAYNDDDGNTVYCEQCDTWQHIECYYHGRGVPEEHFCADCRPRELDAKRAHERQKRLREQLPGGDRKIKQRPSSKSQKRRTKEHGPNSEQTNGWHSHDRHDSVLSNRDQPPPAKKTKMSHRNSGSVASLNGTPTFSESRKRASSNVQSYPSPSRSPQDLFQFPSIPKYTVDFLELYDRDEGRDDVSPEATNIYNNIQVLQKINDWHDDPQMLAAENGKPNPEPPFIDTEILFTPSMWPQVSVEIAENKDNEFEGRVPTWRLLRLQDNVAKDDLVGEIAGEVGLLEVYSQAGQPNRWQELHHPDPFVFFHQHMNIYIDSKKFGTKFRYLRRSCRPNLTLKTFVSRDREYHHCFVAVRDIPAGSELTASWFLPKERFNDEKDDSEERSYKQIVWASNLLANFGDCACDRTLPCLLASVDRRYPAKTLDLSGKQTNGKKRRNKGKHTISPMSTGQATNSRAGSEAVKPFDDDDPFDRRSLSGSSHSNPGSRDLTPTNNIGILDADPVLGPGLSARERRKIAAAEKAFQRAEQDQQIQKKKKRTSGGSTLNTPNASNFGLGQDGNMYPATPTATNYVSRSDGKAQQMQSGSPPPSRPLDSQHHSNHFISKTSPTAETPRAKSVPLGQYVRPVYVDASIQTDPEEPDEGLLKRRRKFVNPTQRLLRRVFHDRVRYEQQNQGKTPPFATISSSPVDAICVSPVVQTKTEIDVEMRDVALSAKSSSAGSPVVSRSPLPSPSASTINNSIGSSPLPLPSQAAHSHRTVAPPDARQLQLSTLPPVPSFPNDVGHIPTTPVGNNTALTTPSLAQSPFSFGIGSNAYAGLSSSLTAPSPIKKKLSLGDYLSRRSTIASTPTSEKTQAEANALMEESSMADKLTLKNERAASGNLAVMVKPNESIKEEAVAMGGMEGSAIDDILTKDEPTVNTSDEQATAAAQSQSGQPLAGPQTIKMQQSAAGKKPFQPPQEVLNVLAMLRQMTPQNSSSQST